MSKNLHFWQASRALAVQIHQSFPFQTSLSARPPFPQHPPLSPTPHSTASAPLSSLSLSLSTQRTSIGRAEMGEEGAPKSSDAERDREDAAEVGDDGNSTCDFCGEAAAVVYCRADSARLCLQCDRHVHAANSVSPRHPRALLCDACRLAPAALFCSSAPHRVLLCSNCDFDAHPSHSDLHDRRPIEPFSGCPSAVELASIFGVDGDEKSFISGAGEEDMDDDGGVGWPFSDEQWMCEANPVFSLEDLIVPTTSLHGFQAMGMPPLPKNRKSACGKNKEEILRQLRQLIKSEAHAGNDCDELEAVLEFPSPVPERKLQQENFGYDFDHHVTCIVAPGSEDSAVEWNHNEYHESTDAATFSYEQLIGTASKVNASFLDGTADFHSSASHASGNEGDQGHYIINEKTMPLAPKGGIELRPDRDSVISRYKQKRKTRRYDKLIRYESRKTRADSRVRIKGRFAKANQGAGS